MPAHPQEADCAETACKTSLLHDGLGLQGHGATSHVDGSAAHPPGQMLAWQPAFQGSILSAGAPAAQQALMATAGGARVLPFVQSGGGCLRAAKAPPRCVALHPSPLPL